MSSLDSEPKNSPHTENSNADIDESAGAPVFNNAEVGATKDEKNPYAYLKLDGFSSEMFKIEIENLPKIYGYIEVKKLLEHKLKLNPHKIKYSGNGSKQMVFVTFRSEEERENAMSTIDGFEWKGKLLKAVKAKAAQDPMVHKRKFQEVANSEENLVSEPTQEISNPSLSVAERVKLATSPWHDVPYPDQLKRKMEESLSLAKQIAMKINSVNPSIKRSELIFPVEDIKPSPITVAYRNKSEFSIGYNPDTKEVTVGFRLASYRKGCVSVAPVEDLPHLSKLMIDGAIVFQDYIRASQYKPFDPETYVGCWKQLTVRTTSGGQLMLLAICSTREMSEEEVKKLKEEMTEHFSALKTVSIQSMFFKVMEKHGQSEKNLPELLFGDKFITEIVSGIRFRISPEAFFQVNTQAAEILYDTIGNLADVDEETTLLDICCGTGTIGLSLASKCGQVIGIEMISSAAKDAQENAKLNNLSDKCEFFAGKAEDFLEPVLLRCKFKKIVAVVDPPRAGLHQRVIQTLRKCEKIKRLVYAACDANASMRSFCDFARPSSKNYRGKPFLPSKIIPVDMFPDSPHFELVVLFER